ncbi:response regulator [Paracoccus benzoatiresistens]|uniref:Response regulator n=1 Tax=Paracoccus benzoatiresistens TaxID=2997341 RepID=A0ABT4JAL3_9RHOB|nr:response regulator [Paracoccus sp. EF6]MCZ0964126.1 response regulator [Paracoccus sp. EF6]
MPDKSVQCPRDGRALVLVVEDEMMIALDVQMMLEDNGYRVLGPAGSVEGALRLLEDTRPDVAVLDGNLRGQPVVPVARRLRSLDIPFVLSSAYDIFTFDGSEVLAGAENVQKPVSERRLMAALERVLS